ncbi:MAG: hypothetical protein RLZ98_1506 [Pseudomonadota bacterium]
MNDPVNAFVERFDIEAAGPGPLSGLSFAVKDLYDVAGHPTGAGNPEWKRTHALPKTSAPLVDMLLEAGARCVGKTHTDELAYSLMGANAHYGTPTNSAAPDRVPGGSSSGSASAVAAGLADFALGSDTGGSVRLPASFCGIYGLRPTHGALPMAGIVPLAPSFDVAGWFARDVGILSRVAAVFAIASPADSIPERLALLAPADMWAIPDPGVAEALAPLRERLQARFARADETPLSSEGTEQWRETFRVCQAAEVWQAHGAWVSSNNPQFGPGVKQRFEMASRITDAEADAARTARARIRSEVESRLTAGTVMILPTAPGPAPLKTADDHEIERYRAAALSLLCTAGLAGLPQISIPGAMVAGAPVGFSIVGARGQEGLLLALAAALARPS